LTVPEDDTIEERRQSFGGIAGEYDRFRPGPPDEAVEWLVPAAASDVLEIGAGTGALTRQLIRRSAHVRAVEPDARMRAVLAARAPTAEVVAGRAEDLPAAEASVDVVIGASMWHWVDAELALPEVVRVLRPGGTFSLLWNGPDRSVDWMRSLWAGGTEPRADQIEGEDAQRRARHLVDLGPESPFAEPERRVVRWTRAMTADELVGLAGTYSAIVTMREPERSDCLRSMSRFLGAQRVPTTNGKMDVPMRCLCWRTSLR
jgi:SAM-dependent methyltransferase